MDRTRTQQSRQPFGVVGGSYRDVPSSEGQALQYELDREDVARVIAFPRARSSHRTGNCAACVPASAAKDASGDDGDPDPDSSITPRLRAIIRARLDPAVADFVDLLLDLRGAP